MPKPATKTFTAPVRCNPIALLQDPDYVVRAVTAARTACLDQMKQEGWVQDESIVPTVFLEVTFTGKKPVK